MSASSPAERKALVASSPYKTVAQRKALMQRAIAGLGDTVEVDTTHGFVKPSGLLLWILEGSRGPRTTRKQAIERLAKKSGNYGARGGQLGAVTLYELRRKKMVRWVPPDWPHLKSNRLTLDRLMEALVTNSGGQRVPGWLYPPKYESLDDYRDRAAGLRILTGS